MYTHTQCKAWDSNIQDGSKQAKCYVQNTIFETYYQIDRTARERERERKTHKFFYALLLIIQQSFNIYNTHTHTYRMMKAIDSGSLKTKVKRARKKTTNCRTITHHILTHTLQKTPLIYIHKSFSIQTLLHSSFVFSFSVVVGVNDDGVCGGSWKRLCQNEPLYLWPYAIYVSHTIVHADLFLSANLLQPVSAYCIC